MEAGEGQTLEGRWRLESLLGEGAMGRVYLGRQLTIDREVAVKLIHPRHINSSTAAPRFLREARILASLQHPHIVRLIDSGFDPATQQLYLVMERLRGQTLSQHLEQRPALALRELLALAEQVLLALAEVHHHGIIHRDLKPGNIFIQERGPQGLHATLFDFGIALAHDPERNRITGEGVIQGTPDYIAPEQIEDAEITARTDLYALGLILYRLCSGELPFHGDTAVQVFLQKLHQSAPPLTRRWALAEPATPDLTALIDRMVARQPEQRPRDALEALRIIQEQRAWLSSPAHGARPVGRVTAPNWNVSLTQEEAPLASPPRLRDRASAESTLALEDLDLRRLRDPDKGA